MKQLRETQHSDNASPMRAPMRLPAALAHIQAVTRAMQKSISSCDTVVATTA